MSLPLGRRRLAQAQGKGEPAAGTGRYKSRCLEAVCPATYRVYFGRMTNQRELPRLPQARMYLKSAQWGFDKLLAKRLTGYAFRFHLIGVLASLRTVQHALKGHDRTLPDEHKRVIDQWWNSTPLAIPELHFIRTSRNLILKTGAFESVCD
jgi:hypothetical protein